MKLARLVRTSSFRLTLLYAAITGTSFLVMFSVVMWSTSSFIKQQIDSGVAAELREIHMAAAGTSVKSLAPVIDSSIKELSGFHYVLQDADGERVAGDLPPLLPVPGIRDQLAGAFGKRVAAAEVRGFGEATSDGGYLFVGTSSHQIHELRESVTRSFLLGLSVAMLLVLAGGAVMSVAVLRRIEEVSQTSRDIVDGDLGRRIALNGSGDEFDHLAVSLNGMLDRITRLMEDLKQVSVDVAHDLRTPLTRLRQRLELAQASASGSDRLQPTIGEALVDIDGILQTFSALLRISQIESGHRRANFGPVDVADIVDTVVDLYQPVIEDKSQQLVVRQDRELSVHGDRELLIQMLVNLIENASRHTPAGTHIALVSRRSEDAVVLTVADDGPGIPAAYRTRVLHRFFRLDVSRSTPGNGLGLCLVHAVSTLHGADLTLQENDPGLEVSIAFPLVQRSARV